MTRLLEALFGPLFMKEMLEISRRRRYYVLRVVYTVVLLAMAYGILQDVGGVRGYRESIRVMAKVGNQFFVAAIIWQILAVHLTAPLLVAGTFCEERRKGSFDLLLITPLSEREILFGKIGSRIVVMLLLMASGFPLLGLALLLGGTDPAMLILAEAFTVAIVIDIASLSVAIAVDAPTTAEAVRQIYLYLGAIWFVLGCPLVVVAAQIGVFDPVGFACIIFVMLLRVPFVFSAFVHATSALRRQRGALSESMAPLKTPVTSNRVEETLEAPAISVTPHAISENVNADELLEKIRSRMSWFKSDRFRQQADGCLGGVMGFGLLFGGLSILGLPIFYLWFFQLELTLISAGLSAQVATNGVLSRSQSLRDLALLTPLETPQLLRAALRSIAQPALFLAIFAFFVLCMRISELTGTLVVCATWLPFSALCVLNGLLHSLVARTRLEAFWGAVLFPIGMATVPVLAQPTVDEYGSLPLGLFLFLAPCAAVIAGRKYRSDASGRNLGLLFLSVHLSLLAGLVALPSMIDSGGNASRIAFLSPLFWTHQAHSGTYYSFERAPPVSLETGLYTGYLAALFLNVALVVWWLLHDFDRLVDRPHRTPRNPGPPVTVVVEPAP